MENSKKTLPEQVIEAGQAFTRVLEMENEILHKQLQSILKDCEANFSYMLRMATEELALSRGKLDVTAQHYLDEFQKAKTDLLQSFPKQANDTAAAVPPPVVPSASETTNDVDKALIQALSLSFTNTVTAQQQTNILHQASITQGIMQIYSVCTVMLAISVNEYFNNPPLSDSTPVEKK